MIWHDVDFLRQRPHFSFFKFCDSRGTTTWIDCQMSPGGSFLFSFLVTWDECFTYLYVVVCLLLYNCHHHHLLLSLDWPLSSFRSSSSRREFVNWFWIPSPPSETQNPPVRRRRTQSDGQIYLTKMIMMCRTCGWRISTFGCGGMYPPWLTMTPGTAMVP